MKIEKKIYLIKSYAQAKRLSGQYIKHPDRFIIQENGKYYYRTGRFKRRMIYSYKMANTFNWVTKWKNSNLIRKFYAYTKKH